jgi:cytoskeletal protein RodZ
MQSATLYVVYNALHGTLRSVSFPAFCMNTHRRKRSKLHLKVRPMVKLEYRQPRKRSLKIILAGILIAVVVIGALGVAAVNVLKNLRLKHGGQTQVASANASASPVIVGSQNPVVATTAPSPAISARPSPSVVTTPVVAAKPSPSVVATPVPVNSPVRQPTPLVSNDAPREKKLPAEVVRKNAEQARRDAERKRTHLEDMHKKHLISDEAYQKGQDEYQNELGKYRSRVGGQD